MSLKVATSLCVLLNLLTLNFAQADLTLDDRTQAELAGSKAWLNLLHYRQNIFSNQVQSQADDQDFFYSAIGNIDAAAELSAFIKAINEKNAQTINPACRFPARYQWLQQQLPESIDLPDVRCDELEDWLDKLNAEHVTLVFAASYLNSPSSMFGHTFLRVDPKGMAADNLLLAQTISYAADAGEHDNELMFAYRGIFGGYPGITNVEPYYQKLKLYSDIENRDLWEYRLDLTASEVRTLLLHTWEVKDINFDYFFFDENCAYRLFTLIDVARPGLEITDALPTLRAIPSDTVRVVVAKGIVSDIQYRPASASVVRYQLAQLSPQQQNAVEDFLTLDFAPSGTLSTAEKAEALETAYELQRFRTIDEKLPREISAPVSFALLRERGEIDLLTNPRKPEAPQIRDDQGHDTLRIGLFGGRFADRNYAAFEWRPAYHDLDDPLPGYRQGAHLQFFNTQVRWYGDNDEVQLEHFKFVEIISLTPRNRFFKPWSWEAGVGGRRSWLQGNKKVFTPYVNGFIGSTYKAGSLLASALITANAEPSALLPDGGFLEGGVALQLNYQNQNWRWSISGEQRADALNSNEGRRFTEAKLSYSVNSTNALQIRITELHSKFDSTMDIGVGWYGYF